MILVCPAQLQEKGKYWSIQKNENFKEKKKKWKQTNDGDESFISLKPFRSNKKEESLKKVRNEKIFGSVNKFLFLVLLRASSWMTKNLFLPCSAQHHQKREKDGRGETGEQKKQRSGFFIIHEIFCSSDLRAILSPFPHSLLFSFYFEDLCGVRYKFL